jgi:flagellar biosynthesis/type III secretory pathway protein FliH
MEKDKEPLATSISKDNFEEMLERDQVFSEQANRMLAQAKTEAEKFHQKLLVEADKQCKHIENLLETRQERFVQSEVARRGAQAVLEISSKTASIHEEFEKLTPWITKLVEQSVLKITGSIDPSDLVSQIVRESMTAIYPRNSILLRVHPNGYKAAEAAMKAYPERFSGVRELLSDKSMKPGQLFLETEGGFAEIGLQAQLNTLLEELEICITDGPSI